MSSYELPPGHDDDPPYWIIESIDPEDLLKPVNRQAAVYAEQKRQARGAFNVCILFACLGVVQAVAGIASVFCAWIPPMGASMLLGAGGVFGVLSNWAFKLSDNANTRLDRIATDEKARELIAGISNPVKRDEELSRLVRALAARAK